MKRTNDTGCAVPVSPSCWSCQWELAMKFLHILPSLLGFFSISPCFLSRMLFMGRMLHFSHECFMFQINFSKIYLLLHFNNYFYMSISIHYLKSKLMYLNSATQITKCDSFLPCHVQGMHTFILMGYFLLWAPISLPDLFLIFMCYWKCILC